jgi:hypothetical protein
VSPLLRILGELRNKIYEYLFAVLRIYAMDWDHLGEENNRARSIYLKGPKWKNILAITEVCRQAHSEAALLVYRFGSFGSDCSDPQPFESFLNKLSKKQRDAIQTVELSSLCFARLSYLQPPPRMRFLIIRRWTSQGSCVRLPDRWCSTLRELPCVQKFIVRRDLSGYMGSNNPNIASWTDEGTATIPGLTDAEVEKIDREVREIDQLTVLSIQNCLGRTNIDVVFHYSKSLPRNTMVIRISSR